MDISIVVPSYNEDESLPHLAEWIDRVMKEHGFTYEVSRELSLEKVLILKRIMMLSKRHRTTIKPAVDNLRNTMHLLTALRTLDGYGIHIWSVKLDVLRAIIRHTL